MDLSSMFQNLGPTGGAMLTGMQMADATNEQRSQEAYRKAQMEDIMQRTSQQAELHPLELQSKKQLIDKSAQDIQKGTVELEKAKNDLTIGKLEGAVKKADSYSQLMGVAAAQLANIPVKAPGDPSRHNFLAKFATDNGLDLKDPAIQGLIQQTSQIPPEKLPQALEAFRNKIIQQGASYRSHIDGLKIAGQTSRDVAEIGARSREAIANAKKKATDIVSQVQGGKLSYEKAAVAFSVMAEMTDEPTDKAKYLQMAQTYEQLNLNAKNAASQGKIDPGAATGLPTIQTPTVLGGGGPKKGTAENPIKLD
jgi:hypothetical protein